MSWRDGEWGKVKAIHFALSVREHGKVVNLRNTIARSEYQGVASSLCRRRRPCMVMVDGRSLTLDTNK